MQDRNHIADLSTLKILITTCAGIQKQTAGRIGEKSVRPDFRVHRLREHVTEGEPEDVAAQIINIRDGASVATECSLRVQPNFGSALAHAVHPAIQDAEESEISK